MFDKLQLVGPELYITYQAGFADMLKSLLQKSEREQNNVRVSTPEECNVYSQQAILLRLCSEERQGDPTLGSNECRSSEQSRVAESRRAINIALLRSEERTAEEAKALSTFHSASHSWTFARGSKAYRTLIISSPKPSSGQLHIAGSQRSHADA